MMPKEILKIKDKTVLRAKRSELLLKLGECELTMISYSKLKIKIIRQLAATHEALKAL